METPMNSSLPPEVPPLHPPRSLPWSLVLDLLAPETLELIPSQNSQNLVLKKITHKVSEVDSYSLFVAIRGHQFDGHSFLPQALDKGAGAFIVEEVSLVPPQFLGPVLRVKNSRKALSALADLWFEHPTRSINVFGVTGTNGKTTSIYLMEHILKKIGLQTGVIGTINHHLGGLVWATEMTTPDPLSLQSRIQEMIDHGAKALCMEVSSHALDQNRVDDIDFNIGLFTNLSRDHLDYHKTMESYFLSKQRFFSDLLARSPRGIAIVNLDDSWGRRIQIPSDLQLRTFAMGNQNADFQFEILNSNLEGMELEIRTPYGSCVGRVPLCGAFNAYNVVGVVVSAAAMGIPMSTSLQCLEDFPGTPGRLQRVGSISETSSSHVEPITVFVDYAHTPDALDKVLRTIYEVRGGEGSRRKKEGEKKKSIFLVFGCGGDRDVGKRPIMAQIAEKMGVSQVFLTSDNPRTEDPESILRNICSGFSETYASKNVHIDVDRKKAIEWAISEAFKISPNLKKEGERGEGSESPVVLIVGKGHENYQILGSVKHPFDDVKVASEVLGRLKR